MTDIHPGMSVHLVKMPERPNRSMPLVQPPGMQGFGDYHISDAVKLGDVGTVVGYDVQHMKLPMYQVQFKSGGFWLPRQFIEPTSPACVKIEQPAVREEGFYWVKEELEGWTPAQWGKYFDERKWFYPGSDIPYDDADFEQIGPRIQPPEGLR